MDLEQLGKLGKLAGEKESESHVLLPDRCRARHSLSLASRTCSAKTSRGARLRGLGWSKNSEASFLR
eukprot:g19668.t1